MKTRTDILDAFYRIATQPNNGLAISNDKHAASFAEILELIHFVRKSLVGLLGEQQAIVAFSVPSGPLALAIELAIWGQGHIALALPYKVTEQEANNYFAVVSPALLILENQQEQSYWTKAAPLNCGISLVDGYVIRNVKEQDNIIAQYAKDPLQIQFTSGSSGVPKALVFDTEAVAAGINQTRDWYNEFPLAPAFSILPQHHAMGRSIIFECLWSGRPVLTTNTMTFGDHKKRILEHQCGLILSNPTYVRFGLQINLWKSLTCINRFILGTAAVEPELPVQIRTQLPQAHVDIRYGVSEAVGALTRLSLPPASYIHSAGHVGMPMPLVNVSAPPEHLAPGLVTATGKTAASAIIIGHRIESISDDGDGIITGDFGVLDEQKGLVLHGRSNVFLKHRGHRIDPIEIETTILSISSVTDVVVIGVPDDSDGEKIIAVVESKQNDHDDATILDHCKQKLSSHKIPAKVVSIGSIPRNPSGKPDRKATLAKVLSHN